MRAYVIRRLLLMIPTLLLASFMIFFLVHIIPGDIIDAMQAVPGVDEQLDRPALEREMGLDAPLITQYGRWLGIVPGVDGSLSGVFQGNLGASWWAKTPVLKLVALKWPVTLELGILALIISQLIALPVGLYSALRQDKLGDYLGRSFAIMCISVPGFWLGTLIIVFPSIWWGYMPSIMLIPFSEDPIGNLKMFIVPAAVLGMAMCGMTMRMIRTMMLEVLRQDYVRTAWSKGLKERVVVVRHALKNALIPVVTVVGLRVPLILGGTVIIESIFGLPGMGRLLVDAMDKRDHPLIGGAMLLFAGGLIVTNLLVDLTYGFLDPRIHYQ